MSFATLLDMVRRIALAALVTLAMSVDVSSSGYAEEAEAETRRLHRLARERHRACAKAANAVNALVARVGEGRRADLDALLEAIRDSHLGPGIRAAFTQWSPPTGEFEEFRIRHTP